MADFAWVTHAAGPRKGTRKWVNLDKVTDMVPERAENLTVELGTERFQLARRIGQATESNGEE